MDHELKIRSGCPVEHTKPVLRGTFLPVFKVGDRRCLVVKAKPRPQYIQRRTGTACTRDWVGLGAGLDGSRKDCPHRSSNSGQSSPPRVGVSQSTVYCVEGLTFKTIN